MTECKTEQLEFQGIGRKKLEVLFDQIDLSSDGGALILREYCEREKIFPELAACFVDYREESRVDHSVEALLKQRIYGLLCGYEDLNDHDDLRNDSIFKLLVGNIPDPTNPLSSKSTLNRLECTKESVSESERYCKIVCEELRIREFLLRRFIKYAKKNKLQEIILDFDATDIPLFGNQEGKFFHGYYKSYCYLPLYGFCGDFPVYVLQRPSNIDASLGTKEALEYLHSRLREELPGIRIIFRADSGFCRDEIMSFCEENKIDFIIGIPKNKVLERNLTPAMEEAKRLFDATKVATRVFEEFSYETTSGTWTKPRRVVGKAEVLPKGANPRFVVTSIESSEILARDLYQTLYCMRGDAENRIKEQLQLFAGRNSCSSMRANQIRLWLSAIAHLILVEFRIKALAGTALARATVNSIRDKVFKVAARIKVSARRILISLPTSYPFKDLFIQAVSNIC